MNKLFKELNINDIELYHSTNSKMQFKRTKGIDVIYIYSQHNHLINSDKDDIYVALYKEEAAKNERDTEGIVIKYTYE